MKTEFLHPAASDSPPFKDIVLNGSTQHNVQFSDERKWGLYRAYPSIAQAQDTIWKD